MRASIPLCWMVSLATSLAVVAQDREDIAVKAKVAMAIIRFVDFPERRGIDASLRFCVARGGALPLSFVNLIRQVGKATLIDMKSEESGASCDVLYIDSAAPDWRRLLAVPRSGTLTIGDAPGFLAAGGAIELVLTNDAVRFDVNQQELRRQGIRIPAQVLRLARKVQE